MLSTCSTWVASTAASRLLICAYVHGDVCDVHHNAFSATCKRDISVCSCASCEGSLPPISILGCSTLLVTTLLSTITNTASA